MTPKNLFIADAIVVIGFGLPLIFAPQVLTKLYMTDQSPLSDSFIFIARLFGVLLVSSGIGVFAARNAQASIARRAFLLYILFAGLGTAIAHTIAIMQSVQNNLSWTTVAITGALGIWAAILLPKEEKITAD